MIYRRKGAERVSCFFFKAEDGIRGYKVTRVQTCALPISAQDQHRLPVAAQRSALWSRAAFAPVGGQQCRHELHGVLGDGEHGGVGDRIGHSRTSGGKTDRKSVV